MFPQHALHSVQRRHWESRWHLLAVSNKVIASSAEGYWNKADRMNAITLVRGSGHAGGTKR